MARAFQPQYLSDAETAAHLGVSLNHIRNLRKRGVLRFIRIGRCVRIPRHEIDRLVNGGSQDGR